MSDLKIDISQPILLSQEPPPGADAFLRASGGKLAYQAINGIGRWVLCLPPTCQVTEHLRYRSVVQYHIHLSETAAFTLCTNTNPHTGEQTTVIVIPWEGVSDACVP